MVWELAPLNSSTGASKYYFVSKGTYRVGRKDSDITIQSDKTISRVHAEIIVDASPSGNAFQLPFVSAHPKIHLKDLSKFGTFVNKETGSKPVFSSENKEVLLKDGDLITFGTTNTTYRLRFITFCFCIPFLENLSKKNDLCAAISKMGSNVTDKWGPECTHLLIEDSCTLTTDVIDAIISRKPVVLLDWLQNILRQKSLLPEIPSCSSFAPTLMLDCVQPSLSLKIADIQCRESCFSGVTLFLGPLHLYYYQDKLKGLLEAAAANVISICKGFTRKQKVNPTGNSEFIIVPDGGSSKSFGLGANQLSSFKNIPWVSEVEAVKAAISGLFDASAFKSPLCPSSSSSTRETGDAADSEDEAEVTMMYESARLLRFDKILDDNQRLSATHEEDKATVASTTIQKSATNTGFRSLSKRAYLEASSQPAYGIQKVSPYKGRLKGEVCQVQQPMTDESGAESHQPNNKSNIKSESDGDCEAVVHPKFDVLYVPNLIAKNTDYGKSPYASNAGVPNFKCFNKRAAVSGNSFSDLIPFAKDPYKESDYGREMAEYMKEEKKRKEAEALAEDLFNADRLKRKRGVRLH